MYDPNLFNVDTTGVQEMSGFEVFPAGLYPAIMVAAAKKPTKNNDGAFLECTYQFIDGDLSGKKFTSRLNLWNQNVQAVDIAKRELKSLRLAMGLHDQESRTEAFLNRPVVLDIAVKARKDDPTKAENNLIAIKAYDGAPAQPAQQGLPFAQQAPQQQPPQQQYAPQQQPPQQQYAPQQQFQQGAVAPQPQQAPSRPAFAPNAGATPPWMAGAR